MTIGLSLSGTDYGPLPSAGPAQCSCQQCACSDPVAVAGHWCGACNLNLHLLAEPEQVQPTARRGFRELPRFTQLLVLGKYAELSSDTCYRIWHGRGRTWHRAKVMYALEDFICGVRHDSEAPR
jgi:hypothetical protein